MVEIVNPLQPDSDPLSMFNANIDRYRDEAIQSSLQKDTYSITKFAGTRPSTAIYLLTEGDKKIILKLVAQRKSLRSVFYAYNRWQTAGIPCLKPLATGAMNGYDYLLTEFSEGIVGRNIPVNSSPRDQLASDMGTALAQMREVKVEGFGYMNRDGVGKSPTWEQFLKQGAKEYRINPDAVGQRKQDILSSVIQYVASSPIDPVILHGDYYTHNVFADEKSGKLISIHDPNVMFGDPLWDVAQYQYFNSVYSFWDTQKDPGKAADIKEAYNHELFTFKNAYEKSLGRPLTEVEHRKILGYEILVSCQNFSHWKKNNKQNEISFTQNYLQDRMNKWSETAGAEPSNKLAK